MADTDVPIMPPTRLKVLKRCEMAVAVAATRMEVRKTILGSRRRVVRLVGSEGDIDKRGEEREDERRVPKREPPSYRHWLLAGSDQSARHEVDSLFTSLDISSFPHSSLSALSLPLNESINSSFHSQKYDPHPAHLDLRR